VNGHRINATMYYVLSQAPTPLHSAHTTPTEKNELANHLSYTEGCYTGVITLQANNLWTPLDTITNVNTQHCRVLLASYTGEKRTWSSDDSTTGTRRT